MQIAKIAVEAATYAIDKPYSYGVPAGMDVSVGCRVLVPFGRGNRTSEGIVLSLEEGLPNGPLKALRLNLDGAPVISPREIKLAFWMRQRYFARFMTRSAPFCLPLCGIVIRSCGTCVAVPPFRSCPGKRRRSASFFWTGRKNCLCCARLMARGLSPPCAVWKSGASSPTRRWAAAMCRTRRCSWFGWRFRRRTPPRGRRPGKICAPYVRCGAVPVTARRDRRT